MARKSKNSSSCGQMSGWKHKVCTHRWWENKLDNIEDTTKKYIDDIVTLGSRKHLGRRHDKLRVLKKIKYKEEQEKLANTK